MTTYECTACYTNNFGEMRAVDWDDDDATDMGACMTWIRGAYEEVDRTFNVCFCLFVCAFILHVVFFVCVG